MRIGRVKFGISFYKKNIDIRGSKWLEIIDSSTADSKGRIFSGRFVHVFVDIMSKEWNQRRKYKSLIICGLIILSLIATACSTPHYCISKNLLSEQLSKTANDYNALGFHAVSKRTETTEAVKIQGYAYNPYVGRTVDPVFGSETVYRDTYKFKDENGNMVSFSVQYRIHCEDGLYDVSVCECEVDKSELFNKLCRNENLEGVNRLEYTKPNGEKKMTHDYQGVLFGFLSGVIVVVILGYVFLK